KEKALKEYYRVLKPGGILLTHDIAIMTPSETDRIQSQLSEAINVKVTPLPTAEWRKLYQDAGFDSVESKVGKMSLMTPAGM
ncbi:SAM-dependent methyltransferase, partial [Klebsiella pneumoniae]|nr:SAM-dependent methyltransferase [Klebsiella pneumoniae]